MKAADYVQDQVNRMELQKTWSERLDKIMGGNRTAFCERYDLNNVILCRYERLNIAAGWDAINKIEKAIKKEEGKNI